MSMDPNPYSASATPAGFGAVDPGLARNKVNGPALGIMIISGISIAVRVLMLVLSLAGVGMMAAAAAQQGNQADATASAAQMAGGVLGNVIGIAFNGVTLFGAMKMRDLQSYSLAMTACILSVIPCCSPCVIIGIPFGVWGLVVLNDPMVKGSFR